jgi:hypothetical protein
MDVLTLLNAVKNRPTDIEKLICVFNNLSVPLRIKGSLSGGYVDAGIRRFYYDVRGDIISVEEIA